MTRVHWLDDETMLADWGFSWTSNRITVPRNVEDDIHMLVPDVTPYSRLLGPLYTDPWHPLYLRLDRPPTAEEIAEYEEAARLRREAVAAEARRWPNRLRRALNRAKWRLQALPHLRVMDKRKHPYRDEDDW